MAVILAHIYVGLVCLTFGLYLWHWLTGDDVKKP